MGVEGLEQIEIEIVVFVGPDLEHAEMAIDAGGSQEYAGMLVALIPRSRIASRTIYATPWSIDPAADDPAPAVEEPVFNAVDLAECISRRAVAELAGGDR